MSEVSSESDPASSSEEGEVKDEEPVEDSLEYESDSSSLGADPYLPRGLIESFLRVFKHFTLKIPRGKVRVFLKKNPGGKDQTKPRG